MLFLNLGDSQNTYECGKSFPSQWVQRVREIGLSLMEEVPENEEGDWDLRCVWWDQCLVRRIRTSFKS